MKKIKAFTILELIMVLLLSLIIFGIAYMSLNIVQNRYQYFAKVSAKIIELDNLNYLLHRDFARSSIIKADGSELHCIQDSVDVIYSWDREFVFRRQYDLIDTFVLEVPEVKMFMLGNEIPSNTGIIDAITFKTDYKGEEFNYYINKKYTAAELVAMKIDYKE